MTIHQDAGEPSSSHTGRWLLGGGVLLIAGLLAAGIIPRLSRERRIVAEETAVNAVPIVTVAPVKPGNKSVDILLPANLLGLHEVALYPRSSGYVKRFLVDIGSRVTEGQLLAEIETPELDQELSVARATLEQIKATSELTRTTLERWKNLSEAGVATKQEFDEKQAAYNVSRANMNASQASVDRLVELKRFSRLVAPFSGVVISRGIEVGALVSATTLPARPLYTISQVDTLRVIANVPQDAAPAVHPGQEVSVMVQELGGEPFRGKISRTTSAIDPVTRTLQISILIVNTARKLMPGMYAQVKLTTPRGPTSLVVPANTLIIRSDGPQVAVVREGRVHMTKVTLGRDFGTTVEALTGLNANDQLVVNPGDDVVDGAAVKVASTRTQK